jgi:2,4-dienoyl-CoA reductase-like NADH-dependent reductase (Old Yellow Enzyme family)
MSILFEPIIINNMEIKNHFVRSATYDALADENGKVTEAQISIYRELAKGGVGLIIMGITYVHSSGQRFKNQNSIACDDTIPGLRKLTSAVHNEGAKIVLQLFHGGKECVAFQKSINKIALAPSFIDAHNSEEAYREIREEEIWEIIHSFGEGANRAKEAGFDGVQIHAAHGYLFSQFLSPFTNKRKDKWGGSLDNRLGFHKEVYLEIRRKVGKEYPILIKIGVQDGFQGGLELSEGEIASRLLSKLGYDALEISIGLRGRTYEESEFRTKIDSVEKEAYFREWCKNIKSKVNVPIIIVGGLRTFRLMEEILDKGDADLVSLSRPLIREPNLISIWEKNRVYQPKCISCNKCLETVRSGKPLACFHERKEFLNKN